MAELTQQEKLQPSLLDRLADDEPAEEIESRDKRILSLRQLRKSVHRDLGWLLNTCNLSCAVDLDGYSEVTSSVLNYGLPELTGRTLMSLDRAGLERLLKKTILYYEPRILENSLRIRIDIDTNEMSHKALTFDIEGELWAQPVPMRIYLKTELDLEFGKVKIEDLS